MLGGTEAGIDSQVRPAGRRMALDNGLAVGMTACLRQTRPHPLVFVKVRRSKSA